VLYVILLTLHNLNRWLVLIIGLWASWQITSSWLTRQPWRARHVTLARAFAWLLNLQFLLGLGLYLLPGALVQAVLQNLPWAQIMQDRLLRFFTLEHPLQMFVAIGFAHAALSTARRIQNERRRYRWTAILLIVAMLLILTAIPWPGLYYGRPWLRLPW
jgi:hypothetical protein